MRAVEKEIGSFPVFPLEKKEMTIYIMLGFSKYKDDLQNIGNHRTGVSCLYLKKLTDIDLNILKKIISVQSKI